MLVMDAQGGGRDARFNLGYNMSLLSGETSPELYGRSAGLNPNLARQGLLPSSCSSRGLKRSSSDVCFEQDVRSVQPLSINTDLGSDVADDGYTQVQQNKKTPPPNGKKTKGRVKIKMEYIDNKLRRYTTFSKRKTGIMKKAYELSTLTGTQVMLLVASETGHVYTFATRKLQPMITSEAGKALIQTCLNSPDPAPTASGGDQRMSATGFEETELTYNISDEEQKDDGASSNSEDEGSGNDADSASGGESPDRGTCDDNGTLPANLLAGSGFSGMGFAGNSRPIFPTPSTLPNGVIFSLSPQIDPGGVNGNNRNNPRQQFITLPYTLAAAAAAAAGNSSGEQTGPATTSTTAADLTTPRK